LENWELSEKKKKERSPQASNQREGCVREFARDSRLKATGVKRKEKPPGSGRKRSTGRENTERESREELSELNGAQGVKQKVKGGASEGHGPRVCSKGGGLEPEPPFHIKLVQKGEGTKKGGSPYGSDES